MCYTGTTISSNSFPAAPGFTIHREASKVKGMFSGIQEILVIVLIIVVILMAPRILQRGRHNSAGSSDALASRIPLSRSLRLAVVLSVIWLVASAAYFQPWKSDLPRFLFAGISPVALLWGVIWIKR